MEKSVLAGIIEKNGKGWRVVITTPDALSCHIQEGERAVIVPGIELDEDKIQIQRDAPGFVKMVEDYIWHT